MSEVVSTVVFLVVIALVSIVVGTTGCANRWMDYETSYGLTTKCMVFYEGRWVPEDRIRILGDK